MRTLAIMVAFCFSGAAFADEKKPEGNWSKKVEGFDIKFAFKKDDMLTFTMGNGTDSCVMEAKCTYEKDSLVKCKVTKYTKNGNFPDINEGYEFNFKFEAKEKKAKISDLKGENISDEAKGVVEGDYEKATD